MDPQTTSAPPRWPLVVRIGAAWTLITGALSFAGWAGQNLGAATGIPFTLQHFLQGLILSGFVVPGLLWLRHRADRRGLGGMGIGSPSSAVRSFAVGFGIVAVPMFLVLSTADLLGWIALDVDLSATGVGLLLLGLVTATLFEALPEEFAFRGYIYHHLNGRFGSWAGSALTVALFVLTPIVLVEIQDHLLEMDVQVNSSDRITMQYVVTLGVFGAIVQDLRVISGLIWTGMGFHLASLMSSRVTGPTPGRFIHVTEQTAPAALQSLTLATIAAMSLIVLAWPKIRPTKAAEERRAIEAV